MQATAGAYRPPCVRDGRPIRKRLRQTLECLLDGHSEKEAARALAVSRHTVHAYVKDLYDLFGVVTRAELMSRFLPPVRGRSLVWLIERGQLRSRRATTDVWVRLGAAERPGRGVGRVGARGGMLSGGVGRGAGQPQGSPPKA